MNSESWSADSRPSSTPGVTRGTMIDAGVDGRGSAAGSQTNAVAVAALRGSRDDVLDRALRGPGGVAEAEVGGTDDEGRARPTPTGLEGGNGHSHHLGGPGDSWEPDCPVNQALELGRGGDSLLRPPRAPPGRPSESDTRVIADRHPHGEHGALTQNPRCCRRRRNDRDGGGAVVLFGRAPRATRPEARPLP